MGKLALTDVKVCVLVRIIWLRIVATELQH
jgi:hypothetical protein